MQYDAAARAEYARWVAAQRRPKTRTCAMCPNTFETVGRQLYCSNTCRIRAYRKRRKFEDGVRAAMAETQPLAVLTPPDPAGAEGE